MPETDVCRGGGRGGGGGGGWGMVSGGCDDGRMESVEGAQREALTGRGKNHTLHCGSTRIIAGNVADLNG